MHGVIRNSSHGVASLLGRINTKSRRIAATSPPIEIGHQFKPLPPNRNDDTESTKIQTCILGSWSASVTIGEFGLPNFHRKIEECR